MPPSVYETLDAALTEQDVNGRRASESGNARPNVPFLGIEQVYPLDNDDNCQNTTREGVLNSV